MKLPKALFLIPTAILFGATLDGWPYVYFQILRWATCICAVLYALRAAESNSKPTAYIFAAIALFFNPIIPFHMKRQAWQFADAAAGVFFLYHGITNIPPLKERC
ncbi:MAG: hypothetical protein LBS53_08905 [Synergistaceae bacterium]|nr:hypothetical protein [Synergistaceae bacterium]